MGRKFKPASSRVIKAIVYANIRDFNLARGSLIIHQPNSEFGNSNLELIVIKEAGQHQLKPETITLLYKYDKNKEYFFPIQIRRKIVNSGYVCNYSGEFEINENKLITALKTENICDSLP